MAKHRSFKLEKFIKRVNNDLLKAYFTQSSIKKYFLLLLIPLLLCFYATLQAETTTPYYTCTRVVDGDTIVVKGIGKVRLIGVDKGITKNRVKM
ncbi:hypothetical protein HQ545_05370 [Candidatus Woesearchaeota archaeon]|nr:hypothetical protein [Candidatus Woesearchaeota archaeon]